MRRVTVWSVALMLAGGLACAGTGGGWSGGGNPDVLTPEQIREVESRHTDMMAIIRNLRPAWLQTRGELSFEKEDADEPVVFVDGVRRGLTTELRQIKATNVERAEYLDAREATNRHGIGYAGGIILIESRSST